VASLHHFPRSHRMPSGSPISTVPP